MAAMMDPYGSTTGAQRRLAALYSPSEEEGAGQPGRDLYGSGGPATGGMSMTGSRRRIGSPWQVAPEQQREQERRMRAAALGAVPRY